MTGEPPTMPDCKLDVTGSPVIRSTAWLDAIHCGDCMEVLSAMPDKSVDSLITDPPYGTTDNEWDTAPELAAWWNHLRRIVKGAVVMTSAQPFTTDVINANRKGFKHEWMWDKVNKHSNYMNAKRAPLRRHENILVFADGEYTYNPQMEQLAVPWVSRRTRGNKAPHYATASVSDAGREVTEKWPSTVLQIPAAMTTNMMHPSQKPLELMRYLVLTYSNPGDVVLDCYAGSGTTLVACKQTGRHYIGIEKEQRYADTTKTRLAQEMCLGV